MDRIWMYGQSIHGWPIANGQLEEPTVSTAYGRLIGDPRYPSAAANLATVGVTAAVVHPWASGTPGWSCPTPRIPPPDSPDAPVRDGTAVYRVTAAPRPGVAFPDTGFRNSSPGSFLLTKPSGTMAIWMLRPGPTAWCSS